MDNEFDEAYARYLGFLVKLDSTDNISEKNLLFRQLTEQLKELEDRLNSNKITSNHLDLEAEESDVTYWI